MLNKKSILPDPEEIKTYYPLSEKQTEVVTSSRKAVNDIVSGKDKRKLVIVWPCSVDFEDSIVEYADFIKWLREKYSSAVEIVMRFYTAKPRTVTWWKWVLHQVPGHEPNIWFWLHESRRIATKVLEMGVPIADEMLYPEITAQYFDDIYSYLAVGARSSENQNHREVASWLNEISIGMKNTTSWDVWIMIESVKAAMSPWIFAMWWSLYESNGNPYAHWILRWAKTGPNADFWHMLSAVEIAKSHWINNLWVLVDASHWNSQKEHKKQIDVIHNLYHEIFWEFWTYQLWLHLIWFMIESYLHEGNQIYNPNTDKRWLSMTDKCLGLKDTEELINFIANQ